ncbi:MAG: phosphohydrolase, partial [Pseudomonadota bacterium]
DLEPKPPWRRRKEDYIASLARKRRESLLVSAADKTHNASAINADLRAVGAEVWKRFTGRKDGTLWYYRSLANAFAEHLPGPASARLAREVDEMEHLAQTH